MRKYYTMLDKANALVITNTNTSFKYIYINIFIISSGDHIRLLASKNAPKCRMKSEIIRVKILQEEKIRNASQLLWYYYSLVLCEHLVGDVQIEYFICVLEAFWWLVSVPHPLVEKGHGCAGAGGAYLGY